MKKNLLVTLGDSFTEGIGCYDPALNPNKVRYYHLPNREKELTLYRFHERGWPNQVGKQLGFDKVINYGLGGSSHDGHLKIFMDKFVPKISALSKEYNLYLIWMMTEPTRMGLYTENDIMRIIPSLGGTKYQTYELEKAYTRDLKRVMFNPIRDQIHTIKLAEFMFKSLGIKYIITSWAENFVDIYDLYVTPNFLTPTPSFILYSRDVSMLSIACGHPNEIGYKYMAGQILKSIKIYHPHFLHEKQDQLEWEWDGDTEYYPRKTNNITDRSKDTII